MPKTIAVTLREKSNESKFKAETADLHTSVFVDCRLAFTLWRR